MVEEVSFLKKDFKQKENKYLADFLNIKTLKEKVEDKLIKQDQSLQTIHMLCKPRPNSNVLKRVAIGYKNPLCLTRAKQAQPALYNGHEIIKENHMQSIVHNSEDTLEIAEITRKKMNDKMNDPECVTHNGKIAPHNYSKDNLLATFTPQKQLTPKQIFWSNDLMKIKSEALKERTKVSRPIKAFTVYPPNTPAALVPKVLPTKSQVKILIFTLIQLFSEFDQTCKKRITPSAITDGERGFEQTKACYLQEDVFEELEAEVVQHAVVRKHDAIELKNPLIANNNLIAEHTVVRKHDAIELKNLLITNDNLIAECLSQEVFCVATNSELNVARFTDMHVANTTAETRCLALEAELAILQETNNQDNQTELINHFSKLEVSHLNLQLKYQDLKDQIGNSPPTPDKDTPDFDSVFVIGKMQASLQGKDNTTDSQITKLTDQVTHLQAQNDLFRAENDKIKQHYKELYDSIKITRAKHIEQVTKVTTKNMNLKTDVNLEMDEDMALDEQAQSSDDEGIGNKMADVNAPSDQTPTMDPPVRTDDQILPHIRWIPIGKSNCYLDLEKSQSNPIYKIARKHMFHPRPDSPLHLSNEEPVLGYLKFSAKGTKREIFGMPIPGRLITANIRAAPYYQEYQENVAKHKGFLVSETRSTQDLPAPRPAKPARKPQSTAQKAPTMPSISSSVTLTQPAPTSVPAKTQENKRKQATGTTDKPAKAERIKCSISRKTRQSRGSPKSVGALEAEEVPGEEHQGPLPPVVIREPESGKYQPLPEVPGKGKAKVSEEQVAHDLLSLQKHNKTSPADQYIFQRRVSKPTASSFHDVSPYEVLGQSDSEEESEKVMLGVKKGSQDEDKSAETEVESMVNVPIQQAMSSISLMTSPIIDLTSRPESPKEHPQLKERWEKHGARLYTLEQLDIPQQVGIAVSEVVTDAVDWAMQVPLRNRFRNLPEADMKEILHQRMCETDSYKSHEVHMQLFEALEKSINRDQSEELTHDLAEARKKRKKSRASPKMPPVSPSHQPPPPPPPAGPSGTSGALRAFESQVTPPPPPPPTSTNQDNPSIGSVTPSPAKTTATTKHQAWSTPDVTLKPLVSLTPEDLDLDEAMGPDEQAQLSDEEDIGRPAYEIVKVFHPDVIHLQYQIEEGHKLLTDSVDDPILSHNVSKPLPLGGPPGQVTIQSDFFFNKDLEYLRYGSKGHRPALSISKMKVACSLDARLEQMVPDQQRFYIDRHTSEGDHSTVRTHMRILSVVRIEVFSMYGYDYMKKIVLRRADLNEHVIAEREFKYLYPSDFEDLNLLNLQGHLNHLSPKDKKILTTAVDQWTRQLVIRQRVEDFQLGIESYQTQSPRAVIFRDKYEVQMMMRFNKIHKFSDGTLQQIVEALDYRVKEFRINRMNPGLNTRFWTRKDVDRCNAFMFAIQRRLRTRRIFRNLKSFVGGCVRDGDYRLLKHHIFSQCFTIVGNKMHKAFPLPGESSHWKYKFPLPVEGVPTARRIEIPLLGVCTAMMKKLSVKENWQLH
nr:integrase, catalytic region, zinc finger, CCHC-type, peptidase aspartic, catalytic [Tanacetum cinerariifolium]